jgi:hypothetical protein
MNDSTSTPAADSAKLAAQLAVDAEHPWLGLASFTEETRGYFYGREEEVAELCRRVQRKLLTILFGQSGLGKTSILRAGIVPRLRKDGYCPVYVRIDYSRDSPSPTEQIKLAIFRATHAAGAWTQPGTAVTGESLWEFLHHRDDVLRDESGKPLIPLLIFDQFEELFTLAQGDDFGRQRAAQFIEDLADLVENRAPKALEAKMDQDESAVERFDFTRSDYRILIALREDYLAHLEGLKGKMPSIAQNRMRLARMTGAQALSAVLKPGGKLVSEEVAGSIVRFIAGGAELANAEVEPALLSLICRELNNARIAQGRSEISADLLAGSRDTILTEFYERALADQPPGVRQVIEDNLLTESGHRESLAEERLQKLLTAAGAPPNALATLVNRRLLRIEERLDVRRVELTHDVLCAVVKASRDLRLEREARDEAERKLAAQRERELATRKALVRARKIAAVCAVLAVGAAVSAVFGYFGMKRAQEAELQAQQTRQMAEQARGEAEKLIVYLLDDFYLELEPVGRLDIVAELAKRALDYYKELPPQLRTAETDRNRALALVRYGTVLRNLSRLDEGGKALTEAVAILEGLRQKGDTSEVTTIGLALGLTAQARTADSLNHYDDARKFAESAAVVIEPLMGAPSPSVRLWRAYGAVMNYQGYSKLRGGDLELAVNALEKAREAYRSVDNLSFEDLSAAAGYAESTAWQMDAIRGLGRAAEAKRKGEEGAQVATKVLEKRPAFMGALRARALINTNLADLEVDSLHLNKALSYGDAGARDWESLLKLDPGNVIAWNNLGGGLQRDAFILFRLGRLNESRDKMLASSAIEQRVRMSAFFAVNQIFAWGPLAQLEAERGNQPQAETALAQVHRLGKIAGEGRQEPYARATLKMLETGFQTAIPVANYDFQSVRRMNMEAIPDASVVQPSGGQMEWIWNVGLAGRYRDLASADYNLKEYAEAEKAIRLGMTYQKRVPERTLERLREEALNQIILAAALARLDRRPEAQQVLAPALKFYGDRQARSSEDLLLRIEFAQALYAAALAGQDAGALTEAAAIIDGLPAPMRNLKSTAYARKLIADEQASPRK